jgi:hypothetical protein
MFVRDSSGSLSDYILWLLQATKARERIAEKPIEAHDGSI